MRKDGDLRLFAIFTFRIWLPKKRSRVTHRVSVSEEERERESVCVCVSA